MEVTVNDRKPIYASLGLVLLGVGIIVAGDGIKTQYKPSQKAYYLADAQASFIRPGLKLEIQKVDLTPPNVVVTFRISDNVGQGLDRLGVETPGAVSTGFVLARIKPGDSQYTNYFTSHVITGPVPGCTTCGSTSVGFDYPAADSGGTYASLNNGVYTYTFGNKLPSNFEVNATHTLGMYSRRDLSDFGFPLNSLGTVANAVLDFVPSGGAVTQVRDVVRTENCNQCHNPLALHGGRRQEIRLCILCHNPSNMDPYTGNSLDAKVYIHKIHMGANLPSVSGKPLNILGTSGSPVTNGIATGATQSPMAGGSVPGGKPYQIIGGQTISDFSTVVWPQDVRNCTTCHQKGTQSDNYKNNPSRAACGSCHDDVNFTTGQRHAGGAQMDDSLCSGCHPADTGLEFDLSVVGVHTIPTNSKQLKGLNVKILDVSNTNPGDKPTVSFTVADNAENPVDVSKLDSFALQLAGPTADYTSAIGLPVPSPEDARKAIAGRTGYTYTFTSALPKDATGAFAVGAQGYRIVTIPGPLAGQSFNLRESFFNPVFYFGIGGSAVVPRRQVVDVNKCNVCHKTLALHGAARRNPEYCVMCHNPKATDTQNPAQTVNFRTHIHRIHRGENLQTDWTINGTNNFNGVRFPGDLRDCDKCHVNNSNLLPLPDGLADAITPRLFYSPTKPTASACLGCHDAKDAAAHTYLMTAPFGESCPVCHEEGADFAVSKVHAR
jgi:OmcA/MtrC family decaheme c-type cytochrome